MAGSARPGLFGGVLLALLFLLPGTPTEADSVAPPTSYVSDAENRECRMFMKAPGRAYRSTSPPPFPYPASGAYRIGSETPEWRVDWYAYGVSLLDCERLVRHGPWARSIDDLAVAFYRRGVETMAYRIGDLVTDADLLRYSVSHLMWRHETELDAATGLLHIETLDGHRYAFSVDGGEIVHHERRVIDDAAELRDAVSSRHHALLFASDRLASDLDLIERIVAEHPHALCHATAAARSDRTIARAALTTRGDAFPCLGADLRQEHDFALLAFEGDHPTGLHALPGSLHEDRDIVMTALRVSARDYRNIESPLRLDRDILRHVIDEGVPAPLFATPKSVREDAALVRRMLHAMVDPESGVARLPERCDDPSAEADVLERCALASRQLLFELRDLSPVVVDEPSVAPMLDAIVMSSVGQERARFADAKALWQQEMKRRAAR